MERAPNGAAGSASGRRGFPRRAAGVCLVALSALTGAGLIVAGLSIEPARPPQPPPAAAPQARAEEDSLRPATPGPAQPAAPGSAQPAPNAATGAPATPTPAGMPRSAPVRIAIPRIDVDAEIIKLGVDERGVIEVPPLARAHLAGWYRLGASPGEAGNAVIVGHVDSRATGPAVFFDLGALRPGDTVDVERTDGTAARFIVDGVTSYPKQDFPTDLVYGPSEAAQLRLVTCGGAFDSARRSYLDNVVVFATLAAD